MAPNSTVLIVGATRGLGASLAQHYASTGHTVYGTARSPTAPTSPTHANLTWLTNTDVSTPTAGPALAASYRAHAATLVDTLIITAGYFATETLETASHAAELTMYTTSAIAPPLIVSALAQAKLFAEGAKIVLVSSESGSIALRHESEGGGNYGHHASKAALNMVGKLLSLDLKEKGVAVAVVHPGFMRTEMTKGVGFDKFWDVGGGEFYPSLSLSLSF